MVTHWVRDRRRCRILGGLLLLPVHASAAPQSRPRHVTCPAARPLLNQMGVTAAPGPTPHSTPHPIPPHPHPSTISPPPTAHPSTPPPSPTSPHPTAHPSPTPCLQVCNFAIGQLFLGAVAAYGLPQVYLFFAAVCGACLAYVPGAVVETKGRSLEEIELAMALPAP